VERRQTDRSLVEERTNGSLIGGEGDEADKGGRERPNPAGLE